VTCFKQFGRIYSSFAYEHTLLLRGLINSVSPSENSYTLTLSCLSANCIGKKLCLLLPKSVWDLVLLKHWGKEGVYRVETANVQLRVLSTLSVYSNLFLY